MRTSALPPGGQDLREADPPLLLNGADAERYRRIIALQQEGDWAAADREIAALKDRLLLGAIEAQRYLHNTYRASYGELARWLAAECGDQGMLAERVAVGRRDRGQQRDLDVLE